MSTFMQVQALSDAIANSTPPSIRVMDGDDINMDSGFRVLNKNAFLRRVYVNQQTEVIKNIITSKNLTEETSGLGYSNTATELFDIYKVDNKIIHDLDFREALYSDFIYNMVGSSFKGFIDNQLDNIYLTPSHAKYVIETFEYINGKSRQVNNSSWITILYHRNHDTVKAYNTLNNYFRDKYYSEIFKLNVSELLTKWLRQEGGVIDLLYFNKLVFAKTELNIIS